MGSREVIVCCVMDKKKKAGGQVLTGAGAGAGAVILTKFQLREPFTELGF